MSDLPNNVSHVSPDHNLPLREQTLLAFGGQTTQPLYGPWANVGREQQVQITFDDATQGILVLGTTGSGKTVTAMEPSVYRLIEAGCSGMVLTTKSADLGIADEFPDRVLMLGASTLCTPVNLIAGMPMNLVRSFLDELRMQNSVAKHDGYFGSRGPVYAELVLETFRLMDRNPTLACIYRALVEPKWFTSQFDDWIGRQTSLPPRYIQLVKGVLADEFNILALGGSRYAREDHENSRTMHEQYTWQTNQLATPLAHFATDARVKEQLCSEEAPPLDMTKLLYEDRKVILTDLPETELGGVGRVANGLLRSRMRNAVLTYSHHREKGFGTDSFTFMVIDEFQHHVSLDNTAAMRGLFDDDSWFSQSREYGHINIVATQGISSVAARLPWGQQPATVRSLLQNLGTTLCFSSHDPDTMEFISTNVFAADGRAAQQIVSGNLQVGEALCLSKHLVRHGGSVVAHVQGGATPGAPHMSYGLQRSKRPVPVGRFAKAEQPMDENPFASQSAGATGWDEWFEQNQGILHEHMLGAMSMSFPRLSNLDDRLDAARDRHGRSLAVDRWASGDDCCAIVIEQVQSQGGWSLTLRIPALKALADQGRTQLEEEDNPLFSESAATLKDSDGWQLRLHPPRGAHDTVALRRERRMEFHITRANWDWIREVADRLYPIYRSARKDFEMTPEYKNQGQNRPESLGRNGKNQD